MSTYLDVETCVQHVWKHNLKEEVKKICDIVEDYPYVAVDTEFPGVVFRPSVRYSNKFAYHYACVKENVNALKLIQLGMSFVNEKGERPDSICCWQFNFNFCESEELSAPDSIELLTKSGVDWDKHSSHGIDPREFSECIMMSGIFFNDDVHWISFHGGYDFGYFLKVLTWEKLPDDPRDFFTCLAKYFPNIFDIKVMMRSLTHFRGGLQMLADHFEIETNGTKHQAGVDSLVTSSVFFCVLSAHFGVETIHLDMHSTTTTSDHHAHGGGGVQHSPHGRFRNILYGLGGLGSPFVFSDD